MTIGEVLNWQHDIDDFYATGEAAGMYQIIKETLRAFYAKAGLTLSSLFDRHSQDQIAYVLLQRRGLDEYLAGDITAIKFANDLCREWAILPLVSGPNRGKSFYDKHAFNSSNIKPGVFLAAVEAVGPSAALDHVKPPKQRPPAPQPRRRSIRAWWEARAAARKERRIARHNRLSRRLRK